MEAATDNERLALEELERHLAMPRTPRDIAKRLGITHTTVQAIEERALRKMRKLIREGWR